MSLLLDTSVVAELRKGHDANPRLLDWFHGVDDRDIHLSVLVMGELRRVGQALRDPAQAAALDRWLTRIGEAYADRVLPVDMRVAEHWGRLTHIRAASVVDTLMAATALVHGLVLVTRDVKDVAWTGVSCLDPFAAARPPGSRSRRGTSPPPIP
jgi:toxin FitB